MDPDAFLDWTKPYTPEQLRRMLGTNYPDSTTVVIGLGSNESIKPCDMAIVEAPRGIWAAWRLNGARTGRVSIAIKDELKDMLGGYIESQTERLKVLAGELPQNIEVVRVPGVTNILTESGPAAIFNVHWLSGGKKRSHPGPSAYLDIRTRGYLELMGNTKVQ